jgi:cytochrome c peroxidase
MLSMWALTAGASGVVEFSDGEMAFIKAHGPWPPSKPADSGNRYSANEAAIDLGERLFSDSRLARTKGMSCAFCHRPEQHFADGLARGVGTKVLDRNTPSLLNVAFNRWFGWDGAADSLWGQSIRPIIAEAEMNADPSVMRQLFRDDPVYRPAITRLAGKSLDELSDDEILATTGKLLAAFQETLITPRTAFDAFRDALLDGDTARAAEYPIEAQRGLKLFTGRGQCSVCHFGPGFTNGEFSNIGIVHMLPDGEVDRGRLHGIEEVGRSKFNLAGSFNDDESGNNAVSTRQLRFRHSSFGEFRVPGLRGVAQTGPYMHNGSLSTLEDVVRHYSELDLDRLHVHGESILVPLHLDDGEVRDLLAFLESLSH